MFGFTAPAHARFDATPTPIKRCIVGIEQQRKRKLAACLLVRADIDGIAAGTVGFPSREEAGFGLGVAHTVGAFDYEFEYDFISVSFLQFKKVATIAFPKRKRGNIIYMLGYLANALLRLYQLFHCFFENIKVILRTFFSYDNVKYFLIRLHKFFYCR